MTDQLCYLCLGAPSTVNAAGYGFAVCAQCWQRAALGWEAAQEPSIFKALSRGGLLIPDRNERGRLPREYAPPADYNL